MAQNYGADPEKLEAYAHTIQCIAQGDEATWSEIRKPRGHYLGHRPLIEIEDQYGTTPRDWTIIAITRCPYEQSLWRIKHMANKEAA